MVPTICTQPSLLETWDSVGSNIEGVNAEFRDATPNQFAENIQTVLDAISDIYLPRDDSPEAPTEVILDELELSMLLNADTEWALQYPYTLNIIATIGQDLKKMEDDSREVTFTDRELLKSDIRAQTITLYANIRRNGVVANGTTSSSISSSKLLAEINRQNPDYTIGYILQMYWINICSR